MKLFHKALFFLVAAAFLMFGASTATASLLHTHTFMWTDAPSGGSIQVTEDVFDNFAGDFSKYEWRYTIDNLSYDPLPGFTNGLSGFNAVFPLAVPELADQYGPAGWAMNCCTAGPPFNAEWDISDIVGLGIPIGGTDVFGFSTAPRFFVITNASWMHSWQGNGQVNIFSGNLSVPGEIIPEPATLGLFGLGLVGLRLFRLRRKN